VRLDKTDAALSWAADEGHETVVQLLLDTDGVNANARDHYSRAPLWGAANTVCVAVVRLLLATGKVDANMRDTTL
jgi:ankyrin repeat protein